MTDPISNLNERLIAPRHDREVLSRPPLNQGVHLAQADAQLLAEPGPQIGKRSLAEFRHWSRRECLEAARRWMSINLGIESPEIDPKLLFVTGHQPQLNHPGVWMKNVTAARLAECCGGLGLNLIVDNDLAGQPVLRCPTGTAADPQIVEIPFDDSYSTQPWEGLQVQNRSLFASFADRVGEVMAGWEIHPVLSQSWPAAIQTLKKTDQLSTLLSACRIAQERAWQIRNLELPVSQLCQTEPFLDFVGHLARNFERLFVHYNQAVHDYRRKYRVRNNRHPVPDLERQGDRYELPFWYWEPGDHDRSRFFISRQGDRLNLFAGERPVAQLSASHPENAPLQQLQQTGRLRTRALTTTLFARLCLGDLFIHGIGGARYDEITNSIISSFFNMPAPSFITLTATLHLPLNAHTVTWQNVSQLKNEIRHLRFSGMPASHDSRVRALQIRRAELIASMKESRTTGETRSERRARRPENRRRHQELRQIQQELAEQASSIRSARESQLEQAREQIQANTILRSREFAACLFPEAKLRQLIELLRRQICSRNPDHQKVTNH